MSGKPCFERCLVFPVEGAGVARFDQESLVKSLFGLRITVQIEQHKPDLLQSA